MSFYYTLIVIILTQNDYSQFLLYNSQHFKWLFNTLQMTVQYTSLSITQNSKWLFTFSLSHFYTSDVYLSHFHCSPQYSNVSLSHFLCSLTPLKDCSYFSFPLNTSNALTSLFFSPQHFFIFYLIAQYINSKWLLYSFLLSLLLYFNCT